MAPRRHGSIEDAHMGFAKFLLWEPQPHMIEDVCSAATPNLRSSPFILRSKEHRAAKDSLKGISEPLIVFAI